MRQKKQNFERKTTSEKERERKDKREVNSKIIITMSVKGESLCYFLTERRVLHSWSEKKLTSQSVLRRSGNCTAENHRNWVTVEHPGTSIVMFGTNYTPTVSSRYCRYRKADVNGVFFFQWHGNHFLYATYM